MEKVFSLLFFTERLELSLKFGENSKKHQKYNLPRRELNPGLLGESQVL